MLNLIRDTLKYSKWILLFIVASFVLFWGVDWWDPGRGGGNGGGDTGWIARVDGRDIDVVQWQLTARQLDERYRQQFGEMYGEIRKSLNLGRMSAEQIVQQQLVLADARRLGLTVSDDELSSFIGALPEFQAATGGFVGTDEYVQRIRRGYYPPFRSERDFEHALREDLLARKWQTMIGSGVVVSSAEVQAEFRRRSEKATFEYVALPYDRLGANITASDAELEAYYKANLSTFGSGEGRRVLYVLFDDKVAEGRVAVSDAEIQQYYEQNKAQFEQPEQRRARHVLLKVAPDAPAPVIEAARKKAQEIADQARSGADFAQLARQFSEDEGSKAGGGDLGLFPRGRMVAEFDDAVFSTSPGSVAGPVRTSFGFHVIRVEQVEPARPQPLEAVKEQIRGSLRFPRLREAALAMAREFKTKVSSEADLRRVAGEMKLEVKDAGVLLQNEPVPGLGPVPPMVDAAFATDKGAVSGVIDMARGAAVLTVQEIIPNHVPPFANRRDRVLAAFRAERSREQAKGQLMAALARSGGDLAKAAADLKLTVQKAEPPFTRGASLPGAGSGSELDELAFSAPIGTISRVTTTDQAAIALRVSSREQADMTKLAAEEAAIREALRTPRADALVQRALEELRKDADIEYNDTLLRQQT